MTTQVINNIGVGWLDISDVISIKRSVNYTLQNTTPYPLELICSVSVPNENDRGHGIFINEPWTICISDYKIFIRNQKQNDNKKGVMVVTESSFVSGPYSTNQGNSVQYPLATDGGSIYAKDIWISESDTTGWEDQSSTGLETVLIPFTGLHSVIANTGSDNPKELIVHFNRTVSLNQVGIGCATPETSFSNTKIIILGSGGAERSVLDDSDNDTKYVSKNYAFGPELGNALKFQFFTPDTICLSNITIHKVTKVASRMEGLTPDGIVKDVNVTEDGDLSMSDNSSGLAIAEGKVQGKTFIHKFGNAPDFDIADDFVTIWDGAEDAADWESMNYNYSTTADIDTISSTNTSDEQTVQIQGLDANWDLVTLDSTLDGQNKVTLDDPLVRIFRLKNTDSTDFEGHIIGYVNTDITDGCPDDKTTIRLVVHDSNNQTAMAIYTIPNNKTGYLRDWYASTAGARRDSTHVIKLIARPFGGVFQLKHTANVAIDGTGYIKHDYTEPEVFEAKTDIEMRANTDQNQAGIASGFDIVLVDN